MKILKDRKERERNRMTEKLKEIQKGSEIVREIKEGDRDRETCKDTEERETRRRKMFRVLACQTC